jgi:hypothetical protein
MFHNAGDDYERRTVVNRDWCSSLSLCVGYGCSFLHVAASSVSKAVNVKYLDFNIKVLVLAHHLVFGRKYSLWEN